jgi:fibronectin-binding autotransporter adhesin
MDSTGETIMKTKNLLVSLVLGLGLVLALLWMLNARLVPVAAAPAAEIRVCTEGAPTCDHASMQAAVDAAGNGDVIKVAAGTYTVVSVRPRNDITTTGVVTQVVYVSKTVTIQGGYTTTNWTKSDPDANPTTLDAQGQGRVFYVVGDVSPIIDGFHITGGDAAGLGGEGTSDEDAGGGVYVDTAIATITNNRIFSNTATCGAGVYAGIRGGPATIGSVIVGNTVFSNTTAVAGGGGGMLLTGGSALVQRNTIRNNYGNGVVVLLSTPHLEENVIRANAAYEYGGGVFLQGSDMTTLTNNIIVDNYVADINGKGSGLYFFGSSARLLNNTIANNTGGNGEGIYLDDWVSGSSSVVMTNTLISDQSVGVDMTEGSTVTVNGILWHNVPVTISLGVTTIVSVQNEIAGDPAFVDPDGGDYHISAGSAARDAGVDSGVPVDIDGEWRPMGQGYDLGADEYADASLTVAKQASLDAVNRGGILTYTIVVTSTGVENATGVVVTDTLDGWQRPVAASSSVGGCTIPDAGWGGSAVCTPGTLAPGTAASVTLAAEISAAATPGQLVVNTAVVKANETASSSAQATANVQDCHVRINADATEYGTVQAAVDAANPGDVVKVAGTCLGVNTYAGLRQQVYVDKSITIRGGYTTTNWTTSESEVNPTTLDALGEGRVLYLIGEISPKIEGLRITGGDAAGLGGVPWGWNAGGGVYVVTATATISDNWIYDNTAGGEFSQGGGVYLGSSDSTVSSNIIFDNTAGWGGGIHVNWWLTPATLSHNTILSNTAIVDGGGVCLWSFVNVLSNRISGNIAHRFGGGVLVGGSTLINNIVADNSADISGSGLYIDRASQLWHTTVARNTGGDGSGIFVTASAAPISVALTNTIVAQHSVGISVTGGNTVTVNGMLWHNVYVNVSQSPTASVSLQNQHWGNPVFVYPDGNDYHIDANSAAIDLGVDAGIGTDIDGQSRPIGAACDLGADEYPCSAVSNVQVSRMPSGDLFTGNAVLFTAVADGSTPFTYIWTLDGGAVGENRSTFEHTFSASGVYTVGVTVSNGCGSDSDTMVVTVSDLPAQQPDLSQSNKTVNLTSVEGGDILTYTLVVRNLSAVSATAMLTDAIPNHTIYVPGSVQASSSTTLTVENGQVRWSGQVITGTPVIIQFAVEVTMTGLSVGDVITNVVTLEDGLGNVVMLEAQSIYNPGYGLSIDDGALYTNVPTVTLRYSWSVDDDIVYVKFSNDGGFGSGSSGWIPVDAIDPTYADWVLETRGDLRMPRTVYVKFRDGSGVQYGPFQDDIIYDPVDPQVVEVEVITQTAGGDLGLMVGQDVIVRVTTSDDNSGASKVQISHSADFAECLEFAVTGATTDIPWTLQSSGEVYVRVVDRAGNLSEVQRGQGPPEYEIYLPVVLRNF